jgi:hypothetical protein
MYLIPPTRLFGQCRASEAVLGHRKNGASLSTKDHNAACLDGVKIAAGLIAPFLPSLPHADHDHPDNSTREHADAISTIIRSGTCHMQSEI